MSIQAVGWALEQDLPARPKLVLVSIANHADHRTGYCYLKAETIADEASCSSRAVFNFVGDLIRNGFIRKELRRGDDGKQRASDYWILFDRGPDTKWLGDRRGDGGGDDEPSDDAATSGEPHAPGACGENDAEPGSDPVDKHALASGPHAHGCMPKSLDQPSKTNLQSEGARPFATPPRSYKAPPIAPTPLGALHPDAAKPVFVYVGTRAWDAWLDHRARKTGLRSCPTTRLFVEGVGWRDGWHFPTLFPPGRETASESSEEASATGPPLKKPA